MKRSKPSSNLYLLEDVRDSLNRSGFVAMTVSEIRRFRDLDKRLGAPILWQRLDPGGLRSEL